MIAEQFIVYIAYMAFVKGFEICREVGHDIEEGRHGEVCPSSLCVSMETNAITELKLIPKTHTSTCITAQVNGSEIHDE